MTSGVYAGAFTLKELQSGVYGAHREPSQVGRPLVGLDTSRKEDYLSDAEFVEAIGMGKALPLRTHALAHTQSDPFS